MSKRQQEYKRRRPKIKFAVDNAFRTPPHKPYRLIPFITDRKLMAVSLSVAMVLTGLTIYDMRQKSKTIVKERKEKELEAMAARLNPTPPAPAPLISKDT